MTLVRLGRRSLRQFQSSELMYKLKRSAMDCGYWPASLIIVCSLSSMNILPWLRRHRMTCARLLLLLQLENYSLRNRFNT